MDSTFSERFYGFLTRVVGLKSFPVAVGYFMMVMLSPLWRKCVQPFDLKMTMVVYNFFCSIFSLYTLIYFLLALLQCEDLFQIIADDSMRYPIFLYCIAKYIELTDTVFMILRHRDRQISFLHVYHHTSILLLADMCTNLFQWPSVAVMMSLNTTVHVFLYFYYGQSALYPKQRPAWKRRLTQLQILQFFVGLIFTTKGYMHHSFCIYGIFYGLSMLVLFANFYFWAFIYKKPEKKHK